MNATAPRPWHAILRDAWRNHHAMLRASAAAERWDLVGAHYRRFLLIHLLAIAGVARDCARRVALPIRERWTLLARVARHFRQANSEMARAGDWRPFWHVLSAFLAAVWSIVRRARG